jgi:hypothetical protein
MEHEERAEHMEEDAERMEEHSDKLGERLDDIQSDWERKEQDPAVPGARPDPAEEEDEMTETPDQSDQLPEEAPPDVVPEDDSGPDEGESESPGVPGEEETGTGNPDAAGAED